MPEPIVPPPPPEPADSFADFSSDAFFDFSFTPVRDGQAFSAAPFKNIFTRLESKLNKIDRNVASLGALTHEHLNAKPPGDIGVASKGYILHSGETVYSRSDSLPPGVWIHSASDSGNVLTSFSAGDLRHWSCSDEGPVGKETRPSLRKSLNFEETEVWDSSQRSYAGGLIVFFDGIIRLIGNYEDQQAPEYEGKGAFYFLLYANVSLNGADFEWYPIPVTERYVDCIPKREKMVPGGRDGLNFSFRHLFTPRSIPFAHSHSAGTLPEIESIKVRAFKVGVSLNNDRSDTRYQTLGFHIQSYHFSYLAITGTRNRILRVPASHGNL